MTPNAAQALFDAGFTPDELRTIAETLQFGIIAVHETGADAHLSGSGVEWTPEKRAAWNTFVGEFIVARHPDDEVGGR